MGTFISVILFFLYTWGFGYTALRFMSETKDWTERNLMRIGVGLGILPIFLIILNFIRIPLDWKIVLAVSIILPLFDLLKSIRDKKLNLNIPKFKLKKSSIHYILLAVIFAFTLFMYTTGSFSYNYLENTDPWSHALGVEYVAEEKTAFDPPRQDLLVKVKDPLTYIDPYPPGYDALLGILHQTNDSVSWTLKFFTSLIISLGIVFFFFFARRFMKSSSKALFATFVLAAIPGYLSHFIWAHALIITLIFPALYCFERIDTDKKWAIVSLLLTASIFVTQPSQPFKIGIMFLLYFIVKSLMTRKFHKYLLASQIGGIALSFVWWGGMIVKYGGVKGLATALGFIAKGSSDAAAVATETASTNFFSLIPRIFNPTGGTATRAYSFNDFFITQHHNMINAPIGWGIFVTILVGLGLLFFLLNYKDLKKKEYWLPVTVIWFIFTFLGVNSMTYNLPIGFVAFRFWLLLALPVALLAAHGAWKLRKYARKIGIPALIIIVILIGGIYFTSAAQKYSANTALWPTRAYFGGGSPQVAQVYGDYFATLPKGTAVFFPTETRLVVGFDMTSCAWCGEVMDTIRDTCMLDMSVEDLHTFLKKYEYEYIILGGGDIKHFGRLCELGEEETVTRFNDLVGRIGSSQLFELAHSQEGLFVSFRVR